MADPAPEQPNADEPPPRGALKLLRDPAFGPYITGQWLSNTGNWFHNVAAGIVVYQLTGSSTLVGAIASLQFLATLLLAPIAGAAADRFDRRRALVTAQSIGLAGATALALVLAVTGVDGLPGVWPLFVATAVIGIGYAFSVPMLQSIVPSLVPRRDMTQAIALHGVSFNLARAIGPALAGLVVASAGAAMAFGLNALSFAVFVAILWWLGKKNRIPANVPSRGSPWAGFALARREPAVRTLLLGTLVVGFATDPVTTLTPALADSLGGDEALTGLLASAFGIGATLSVIAITRLRSRFGPRGHTMIGMSALVCGHTLTATVATVPAALLGMAMAGAGFIHSISTLNTSLQLRVDDSERGRVMALWSVALLGLRPIAAAIHGSIADTAGIRVAMAVGALWALMGAIGLARSRTKGSIRDGQSGDSPTALSRSSS